MRDLVLERTTAQRYEEAVAAGERTQIVALVEELLGAGMAPVDVLTDVVAPAQRIIGERWQRGEWSVAREHAATAMAMAAAEVVSCAIGTQVTRGAVLIACAEREWHSLPAIIIECALRSAGWATTQLGASTSPLRLSQYVQDVGPDAVAASCSTLGSLVTTRRFIEAATAAGIPVVVGGTAFGGDDVRALALGATAWAADAAGAAAAMNSLPAVVDSVRALPEEAAAELAALEIDHHVLVDRVRLRWSLTADSSGDVDLRAVARDALPQTLHAVSAALLTGDHRPVAETASWVSELLRSRGVGPSAAVAALRDALSMTLVDLPLGQTLVRSHFAVG